MRLPIAAALIVAAASLSGCYVDRRSADPQPVVIQREAAPVPAPGTTTYITPGQPSSTVVVEPARRY
ncbi:hypothetical protein [Plastoroseomonas arctica]|uniref:Uncharacterized protein n=1 Tax=Plastoroseomonas arctica TaxID=1509237 RepID=A0AAF1K382_9PROT|nr:hypothetical protein [Plastoroseomonas arctica]MBR0655581.1 hypothetical protein [Plastoroseomonas arctica]